MNGKKDPKIFFSGQYSAIKESALVAAVQCGISSGCACFPLETCDDMPVSAR
jgi:hypothetical protein